MSGLIVDGVTGEKLAKAEGMLPICDRSGKVLGIFQPFYQPRAAKRPKTSRPFPTRKLNGYVTSVAVVRCRRSGKTSTKRTVNS